MTSTLQQSSPTSADPVLVPRGSMATNFRRPLQIRCLFDTGGGCRRLTSADHTKF